MHNPLHAIDGYKSGHVFQYPDNTSFVYSNFTARSSKYANVVKNYMPGDVVVFAGIQGTVVRNYIENWNNNFFKKDKKKVVKQYSRRVRNMLGVADFDTSHIEELHDVGYLPLVIEALPEGSLVNIGVPMLVVYNSDPRFGWLTNYIETELSADTWKTVTNATIAYNYRAILEDYIEKTGGAKFLIPFLSHDFSARGMSGMADAAQAGFAHLTSFSGTDSFLAVDYAEEYYEADVDKQHVGATVPASEHSVMCLRGEEGEIDTINRMLDIYPTGIVSMVLDGFDFFRAINEHLPSLKNRIMSRDGKLVVRPDSGDPVEILCGMLTDGKVFEKEDEVYGYYENCSNFNKLPDVVLVAGEYRTIGQIDPSRIGLGEIIPEVQVKGAVQILYEHFGGVRNEKDYITLDSHIGLIYGDSITPQRMLTILERLKLKGFAADNVVFGVGSFTYQYNTRDSFGMAMKATHAIVDGQEYKIFKNPKTDSGVKRSARGMLAVTGESGNYVLHNDLSLEEWFDISDENKLQVVFRDGELINPTSLSEIRQRLWNWDDSK